MSIWTGRVLSALDRRRQRDVCRLEPHRAYLLMKPRYAFAEYRVRELIEGARGLIVRPV